MIVDGLLTWIKGEAVKVGISPKILIEWWQWWFMGVCIYIVCIYTDCGPFRHWHRWFDGDVHQPTRIGGFRSFGHSSDGSGSTLSWTCRRLQMSMCCFSDSYLPWFLCPSSNKFQDIQKCSWDELEQMKTGALPKMWSGQRPQLSVGSYWSGKQQPCCLANIPSCRWQRTPKNKLCRCWRGAVSPVRAPNVGSHCQTLGAKVKEGSKNSLPTDIFWQYLNIFNIA